MAGMLLLEQMSAIIRMIRNGSLKFRKHPTLVVFHTNKSHEGRKRETP